MVKKKKIIVGPMFEYDGFGCKCVKDIKNIAPGKPEKITLKIYSDISRPLKFAYISGKGLCITGSAGKNIEENILGKLLAIPHGNIEKHIEFIEKYGFLVPASTDEYETVDVDDYMEIINRIKATIYIMNAIGKWNFKSALRYIAYLLYSSPKKLELSTHSLTTCEHKYTKLIEKYNLYPSFNEGEDELNSKINSDPEAFNLGTYSVADTMVDGGINHLNVDFYRKVCSNEKTQIIGTEDQYFKRLMAVYAGCPNLDIRDRKIIDFFYHFQIEVAVLEEIKFGKFKTYTTYNENAINTKMKERLREVAKSVIAEEINYNIKDIQPRCDENTLSESWNLTSLVQALYFSIFYMKAGKEIYKECGNPNCKREKFFLVSATRTNKIYCCHECGGVAAEQRWRQRKKRKETN